MFSVVDLADSQQLTGAIDYVGDTYNGIGDLFQNQVSFYFDSLVKVLLLI